jgi:hypothetical protein
MHTWKWNYSILFVLKRFMLKRSLIAFRDLLNMICIVLQSLRLGIVYDITDIYTLCSNSMP